MDTNEATADEIAVAILTRIPQTIRPNSFASKFTSGASRGSNTILPARSKSQLEMIQALKALGVCQEQIQHIMPFIRDNGDRSDKQQFHDALVQHITDYRDDNTTTPRQHPQQELKT